MYKLLGLLKFLKPKKSSKWLLKLGFFGLLAVGQQLFAQDKTADQEALIKKKYNKASDISIHSQDGENSIYSFKLEGEPHLAYFGENGRWIKTTVERKWDALSRSIQQSYLQENNRIIFKTAHYIHHFLEGKYYQITTIKGEFLKFDEAGKLLD